jgi:tetratricopeptide (TPR) repeat protein
VVYFRFLTGSRRRLSVSRQTLAALCFLALVPVCAAAQLPAGNRAPEPAASLQELILQSRTSEALEHAARSPQAVPEAAKAILRSADNDVTDLNPSAAASKLDALSKFLDEYAKVNKDAEIAREALKGRQLRIQGIQLSNQGEARKAEPILRQALELAEKAGDTFLEAGVHNSLGFALLALADGDDKPSEERLKEAAKEFEQARSLAERQEDSFRAASYGFNLGQAQLRRGQFEAAAAAFRLAAGNFLVVKRDSLVARSLLYQGISLGQLDPASEVPLSLYDEAFKTFEKLGDDSYGGWSLYLMAERLANRQKYAEAAQTAERAVPFLVKGGPKDRLAGCYFLLSEIHSRLGNSALADKYRRLIRDVEIPK